MTRTTEERKEWYGRMSRLAAAVRAMTPAEREAALGRLAGGRILTCEGRALSPHNTLFLAAQANGRDMPTMVGGYRQWAKVGRHVRAGEVAIGYIYVPLGKVIRGNVTDTPEDEPEERMRFRLVPVFDVSQTEAGYAGEGQPSPAVGEEVTA